MSKVKKASFIMAKESIGPKIMKLRKAKGLTQEQFAKSLGYSGKSVIAHIEKGDADMTYEKMLLLIKEYKLDANFLFGTKPVAVSKEEPAINKPRNKGPKGVIVYIHGLHGSAREAKEYRFLKDYDVIGLDYQDGNPWEVGPQIKEQFERITKPYDEVVLIANSIGAFYACEYLSDFKIKRAFFISPIVSMFQMIIDSMVEYGIKDKELKQRGFIELDNGTTLSYDFYQHVSNEEDHWRIPTDILYGAYDEMVYTGSMMEFLENHPLAKLTVKNDAEHYFSSAEEKGFVRSWIRRNLELN